MISSPNEAVQATAAVRFSFATVGDTLLPGSVVAQSPAAVPDLRRCRNPLMKFTSWFLMFMLVTSAEGADLPACRHGFTVIAHRGDHARAHENTLAAIQQAIAAGVDYVEIDVRRTVDGHYVLMHDSTVERMTDGHGRVSELTLKQVQALHVRDPKRPQIPEDHVPTFNETLIVIKGRINLYLDFKDGDRDEVARAIREAGVTKQVLVYDDAESVLAWRRAAPELPLIVSLPENARTPEQHQFYLQAWGGGFGWLVGGLLGANGCRRTKGRSAYLARHSDWPGGPGLF
jgi:glycerophosphoryl diester phosphodiesterase